MCSTSAFKPCDSCGELMTKRVNSARNAPKHGFCTSCYKHLPKVECTKCREAYTTMPREGFICYKCKVQDRKCYHCNTSLIKAQRVIDGKNVCERCAYRILERRPCTVCSKMFSGSADWPEGKPVCSSCRKRLKAEKPCMHCGNLSLFVKSDAKAGIYEPICSRCRTYGRMTCADCHKHRKPAALNKQGKQICKECHERGNSPFICPQCGKPGTKHSKSKCEACYWLDYTVKKVLRCQVVMKHEWSKVLFAEFIQYLSDTHNSNYVASRVERYFPFFAKLDVMFESRADVDAYKLLGELKPDGIRRFTVPYDYLARTNIITPLSRGEIAAAQESSAHQKLLGKAVGHWYEKEMLAFYEYLQELSSRYKQRGWKDKAKYKPRTLTASLRATLLFYEHLETTGITAISQVQQSNLDLFIYEKPGYKDSLRSWVRFINKSKRVFTALKVHNVQRPIPHDAFIPASKFAKLLSAWLSAENEATKSSLICVLMSMYAQTGAKAVKLRMTDVFRDMSGNYKMLLGSAPITFDPRISALFKRYLAFRESYLKIRDDMDNEWLFPGRKFGCHITSAAIGDMIKPFGVTADQMFATAVFNAYQTGMKHPKVLVNAFGISTNTAVKYLQLLDPRVFDEVESINFERHAAS